MGRAFRRTVPQYRTVFKLVVIKKMLYFLFYVNKINYKFSTTEMTFVFFLMFSEEVLD